MKHAKLYVHTAAIILLIGSVIHIQGDEVAAGAFGGAATGALIGGAAGGGRGAGIGAGVGLGLGLISGSAAKSRRKRRERQYQEQQQYYEEQSARKQNRKRQNRNEEYAHQEIIPETMRTENDPGYNGEISVNESTPAMDEYSDNNATIDTATEDTEYKHEEVMPGSDIETSYEDEA